jgi:hypothetical protein
MALTKLTCALVLGGTVATAAILSSTITQARPDAQSWSAGPLPAKETVYRPECWLDDDAARYCNGDDRIRP